ncbi:MAG: acyl-CoA dehydrogenase family protein [Bdellovibrionales bacterium]|nr:acyl-CoA dehydrogenase family protein [Bdellovibrionales bacterium]
MNFEASAVQTELRNLTRKFAQKTIASTVEQDERDGLFRTEYIQELGTLGLTGIPVPEEYGGAGLGYQDYIVAIEELAKVSAAYAISVAVTGLPQIILSSFGTEEQKKHYIPPLASGSAIGAFSLSEAASGSDAGALLTTARLEGDHYVINGTKLWTTQADSAEVMILMARTGGAGPRGISAFIVPRSAPGISMGKRERKMGLHISHTMEVVLSDVRIPVKNMVGTEGEGFKIALSALDSGRITIAAVGIGLAAAALEVAANHARERYQFGKPIGEQQGIQFMMADMSTQLDAARLLVQRAAWLRDNHQPFTTEAAKAKMFATDMAMSVTTNAVQILGGSGYTQDFPVERFMREAKVLQIVEGTNQIQRIIIGREALRSREF